MSTKLNLHKQAVDFAFATLEETDLIKLDSQTLAKAGELDLSEPEYRTFKQIVGTQRNLFAALRRSDEQASREAAAKTKRVAATPAK